MKLLVATSKTQGQRGNDFTFCTDGEIVTFGSECDGEKIDGVCGCRRSMVGIDSHRATTTFQVADSVLVQNVEQLAERIERSLLAGGWTASAAARWSTDDALRIAHVAHSFEVGTILERRGEVIQPRGGGSDGN